MRCGLLTWAVHISLTPEAARLRRSGLEVANAGSPLVMIRAWRRGERIPAGFSVALPGFTPLIAAALGASVLAFMFAVALSFDDEGRQPLRDAATDAARSVGTSLASPAWLLAGLIGVLAVAHYVASAFALSAAAGSRLPLRQSVLVQLTAAAVNRFTPAGLGAAAVNSRYLVRRGHRFADAAAAIAALAVLGALADMGAFAVMLSVGPALDFGGGGPAGTHLIFTRLGGVAAPFLSPWMLLPLSGLLVAIAASRRIRHWLAGLRHLWPPTARLARSPARLAGLLLASACSTLVLAAAFVATVYLMSATGAHQTLGALLVGFMIAGAVGNALPIPGGIGSTEAALVGLLALDGSPAGRATAAVILFRVITFWAPAVLGLIAGQHLRRTSVL